jgi:predicted ATPase
VRHLIRRGGGKGLLVLGTYRDSEVSRAHPLADVLTELRRERLFDRVVLRGLSTDEVIELVAHLSGHAPDDADPDFAMALGAAADGNPFFIEEILRHLVETGALVRRADGRWDTDAASWDELGVPEGVREVIGRRLSRLSPTGEQLMAAGAVLGRAFAGGVVRRMVEVDDEAELDEALAEATALHLLDVVAEEDEATYAFSHALVRET